MIAADQMFFILFPGSILRFHIFLKAGYFAKQLTVTMASKIVKLKMMHS